MASIWAADSEIELSAWSIETRESRIVFSRLNEWNSFTRHASSCARCRRRNIPYGPSIRSVRVTPVGNLCLQCWLDWAACEVCGVGPVAVDEYVNGVSIVFRGRAICAECLVPTIPSSWNDYLFAFYSTPRSSYQLVFEAYPLTWGE